MKQLFTAIKVLFLAVVLSFGLSYALAAWVSPTLNPPGGNVDAPINVGFTAQTKTGPLTLTGGLILPTGAADGSVLTSDAAGNVTWQTAAGGSDNLGNHTATQALDMAGNNVANLGTISANGSGTAYGATSIDGEKNGWGGINFRNSTGGTSYGTLMMNAGYSGFYNATDDNWRWYVDNAGNSIQPGAVSSNSVSAASTVSAGGYMNAPDYYISGIGKWASQLDGTVPLYHCPIYSGGSCTSTCVGQTTTESTCYYNWLNGCAGTRTFTCTYLGRLQP